MKVKDVKAHYPKVYKAIEFLMIEDICCGSIDQEYDLPIEKVAQAQGVLSWIADKKVADLIELPGEYLSQEWEEWKDDLAWEHLVSGEEGIMQALNKAVPGGDAFFDFMYQLFDGDYSDIFVI